MDRIIQYSLPSVSVSVSAFPDFDIECVKCFVFTSRQVPASASSQAVSLSQAINGVLICVLQPTLDTSLEVTAAMHDTRYEIKDTKYHIDTADTNTTTNGLVNRTSHFYMKYNKTS